MHHGDSPECCILLLKKGADPNAVDVYNVAPLATAAGTGGAQSIDLLIKAGANINHRDSESSTALHCAIFRGNIDCFKQLIKHKPDSSIQYKNGLIPMESAFRDDMHLMLDCILNDEETRELIGNDPNLSISS